MILEQNKVQNKKIPLEGTLIFDPMPSPAIQRTETHIVPRALGILDDNNMDQMAALEQRCFAVQAYNFTKGASTCSATLSYISEVSGGVYSFDGRIFSYDFQPKRAVYEDLLSKSKKVEQLWEAIHIENGTNDPKFVPSSKSVAAAYGPEHLVDYSPYYNYMLKEGHPLLVAAGEFDIRDGARSQTIWMKKLLNLSSSFWLQDRKVYHYYDAETKASAVGGYYRTEGSFSLATLPKSGHFAPHDNYDATKAFLDDFITYHKLHCHSASCSVVSKMCSHMNNCNSPKGECTSHGRCSCKANAQGVLYKGADCSYDPLSSWGHQTLKTKGHAYGYYVIDNESDASSEWKLTISSNSSYFNVYASFGEHANPNRFNHEISFENVPANKEFELTDKQFYGHQTLTIAFEVLGFDEKTHTAHYNALSITAQKGSTEAPFLQ